MPTVPPAPETRRKRLVLATIALSVAGAALAASPLCPVRGGGSAIALNAVHQALLLGAAWRWRDGPLARLMAFGLVFGLVELVADALCVRYTGTLDYSPAGSVMLWRSPWWMPLAWMVVAAQVGFVGAQLMERFGAIRGAALSAVVGAVNIPVYEELAYYAGWWRYDHCRRLGHTPLYIVVAELVIGLALAPAARLALSRTLPAALAAGAVAGLATIVGGLVGYGLVEVVLPALT